MSTELERAKAQLTKARAIRDVRKRQLATAEQDFAMATDIYLALLPLEKEAPKK